MKENKYKIAKKAKKEGMAASSAEAAGKSVKWILLAELAFCITGYLVLNPFSGACCILAGAACFLHYKNMAYCVFGGITGDLAGYFLQVCEFSILAVVVVENLVF